jgi:hypothetical protein
MGFSDSFTSVLLDVLTPDTFRFVDWLGLVVETSGACDEFIEKVRASDDIKTIPATYFRGGNDNRDLCVARPLFAKVLSFASRRADTSAGISLSSLT